MKPQIVHVLDPYELVRNPHSPEAATHYIADEGLTIRGWLELTFPGFEEFDRPTYLQLNGADLMREEWSTYTLKKDDRLIFIPVVGDLIFTLILIAIIVAVVLVLFLDVPQINAANTPEADPVYSLNGQQNKNRINEPIEKHYGLVRHWPSYASKSYNQFIGNDQFLYSLFCIGLGEYEIIQKFVGDTPIENFSEIQDEIYQPGEEVTLFPTNVETSEEVQGIELFGPNQTGASGEENEGDYDGPVGPFTANEASTTTKRLEFDVSFDAGLYTSDDEGRLVPLSVEVKFEHRLIDDSGAALGPWVLSVQRSFTFATRTPQRQTLTVAVAEGRYEVRGQRVNNANLSSRAADSVKWASLRAFREGGQNFPPNVMLWAVKAKATNNLNNQTRSLFNLRLQAVLPVYDTENEVWEDAPTRNPIWAMVDILKAEYGMRADDSFVDLQSLTELAAVCEENELFFDWTFDQRGRVWDACKTVLEVARAKPLMRGPLVSAIRDQASTVPVAGFNGNNIIRGSFEAETKLPNKFEHDGLLVEYREQETWTPETVLCLVGFDEGINPKQIQFLGCTDRNRAYRWGLYQRAVELFNRENRRFTTGVEGLTISYGDVIALKHDLLPSENDFIDEQTGRLGHGAITAIFDEADQFVETLITLPYKATFTEPEENDHYISLRKKDGTLGGPFVATPTVDPFVISIGESFDLSEYTVDQYSEPPTYFFGANSNLYELSKVISVEPNQDFEVTISTIPYDGRIYQFDEEIAPPLNRPATPVPPNNLPVISNLQVVTNQANLSQAIVSWNASPIATDYVVEISMDGVDYSTEARTQGTTYTLTVAPGEIWVRVYAIAVVAGPASVWNGFVGQAASKPTAPGGISLTEPFENDQLKVSWEAVGTASSYILGFYNGATLLREIEITGTSYTYKAAVAKQDAQNAATVLSRAVTVKLKAKNTIGESTEVSGTFTNPAPSTLTNISAALVSVAGNMRTYRISAQAGFNYDLERVDVHIDEPAGMTATGGNLVASYFVALNPTGTIDVTMDTGGAVPKNYGLILGANDFWGEEIEYSSKVEFTL